MKLWQGFRFGLQLTGILAGSLAEVVRIEWRRRSIARRAAAIQARRQPRADERGEWQRDEAFERLREHARATVVGVGPLFERAERWP